MKKNSDYTKKIKRFFSAPNSMVFTMLVTLIPMNLFYVFEYGLQTRLESLGFAASPTFLALVFADIIALIRKVELTKEEYALLFNKVYPICIVVILILWMYLLSSKTPHRSSEILYYLIGTCLFIHVIVEKKAHTNK